MPDNINLKEFLGAIKPALSVSIMSADFLNLGKAIISLEESGVKLLHIDVMDGNFCPSLTIGPSVIKQLKSNMLLDVHLMIKEPLDTLDQYIDAGASMITIQFESTIHSHKTLQTIKERNPNIIRGLSLNPGTSYTVAEPLLDEVEMIVLLAVNPGWNGQKFIAATKNKYESIKKLIKEKGKDILTVIDGGVTLENIEQISALKADFVVSGSAVFKGESINRNVQTMMNAIRKS
jgi:ribulose-phosphate 3-epimerase